MAQDMQFSDGSVIKDSIPGLLNNFFDTHLVQKERGQETYFLLKKNMTPEHQQAGINLLHTIIPIEAYQSASFGGYVYKAIYAHDVAKSIELRMMMESVNPGAVVQTQAVQPQTVQPQVVLTQQPAAQSIEEQYNDILKFFIPKCYTIDGVDTVCLEKSSPVSRWDSTEYRAAYPHIQKYNLQERVLTPRIKVYLNGNPETPTEFNELVQGLYMHQLALQEKAKQAAHRVPLAGTRQLRTGALPNAPTPAQVQDLNSQNTHQ